MARFQLNSKVLEGFDSFGLDSDLLQEAIEFNRKLEAAGFQVTITSKGRRTTTRRAAKKKVKRRTTTTTTRKTKTKTKKKRRGAANQAKATRTYWNEVNQIAEDQNCTKKQARKI